jgi:hypothetical protein
MEIDTAKYAEINYKNEVEIGGVDNDDFVNNAIKRFYKLERM